MSGWAWWGWRCLAMKTYDLATDCATREDAVREALRNVGPNEVIQVIEAKVSTAKRYEGADFVPFIGTRNHEIIDRQLREVRP